MTTSAPFTSASIVSSNLVVGDTDVSGGVVEDNIVKVESNAALTFPNSSVDVVKYQVSAQDTLSQYSAATGVITVARAGWYLIGFCARWEFNVTGARQYFILIDSGAGFAFVYEDFRDSNSTTETVFGATGILHLFAAGDKWRMDVKQVSGGNLDIVDSAHNFLYMVPQIFT